MIGTNPYFPAGEENIDDIPIDINDDPNDVLDETTWDDKEEYDE